MMLSAMPSIDPGDIRSTILTAATGQFICQGYRDTSIERIVAAARISKTTFYSHFRSKRDVLEAALDHVEMRQRDQFPPPEPSSDIEDTLIRLSAWIRRISCSSEYIGLFRVSVEFARAEPALAQAIHRQIRDRRSVVWRYFEQLSHAGLIARGDSAMLNAQFGFLSIGGLMTVIPGANLATQDEPSWTRSVATLFFSGYRRPQPKAGPTPGQWPTPPSTLALEPCDDQYEQRRSAGMRLARDQFENLLTTAADSFLENGYRDTALPDISARTGISRMTLRRQFNGKAELFAAAIGHHACTLYRQSEPLPAAQGADEALPQMAAELRARFHRPENIRLLRLIVAQSAAFPALSAAVYALMRKGDLMQLRERFAGWMGSGEIGAACPELAAHHFHTLAINGNAALFRNDEAQTDASPQQVGALFLDGCMTSVQRAP